MVVITFLSRHRRVRRLALLAVALAAGACSRYVVTGGERCYNSLRPAVDTTQPPAQVGGASNRIIGRVVDADDGRPVTYARVGLASPTRSRGMTTDSTGVFSLDSVPPGEYVARGSRLGYAPAQRRIIVSPDAGDTLVIPLKARMLDGPCGVEKIPWWKFWYTPTA